MWNNVWFIIKDKINYDIIENNNLNNEILKFLQNIITHNYKLYLFGSRLQELHWVESDMDIALIDKNININDAEKLIKNYIVNGGTDLNIEKKIDKAQIPRLLLNYKNINIDLTIHKDLDFILADNCIKKLDHD